MTLYRCGSTELQDGRHLLNVTDTIRTDESNHLADLAFANVEPRA
ncbi:hypothetical protein U6G28_05260 [Actinomycetaceae bacterium MB13-C1-2]|nr:hypothetical protein U6G28_05260 [Actinomycetaceae bacterium MB13-C1-2]